MVNLLIFVGGSLILFLVLKIFLVGIFWLSHKLFHTASRFDFTLSTSLYFCFVMLYMIIVSKFERMNRVTFVEDYIALCIIGFVSVIWAYGSWRADKILIKPSWAKKNELKTKKIVIYVLLLIFSSYLGYQQVNGIVNNHQVNQLLVIANYSIITSFIALDRIMTQLYPKS